MTSTDAAVAGGIEPAMFLELGATTQVAGSKDKMYTVKRTSDDQYTCTCPAWAFQGGSGPRRTCKHLKSLLGEEFESARVPPGGSTSKPKRKQAATAKRGRAEDDYAAAGPSKSPKKASSHEKAKSPTSAAADETGKGPISVMLARTWDIDGKASPVGLWAAEKLDGVRAYWDGERLWSRNSNEYEAPRWWKERLPNDVRFDGELFIGRDSFDKCSGWVRAGASVHWKSIHYLVFDAVMDAEVEERWAVAKARCVDGEMSVDDIAKSVESRIAFLPQTKVTSKEHMMQLLDDVQKVGGEGLMLRKPKSKYKGGKTNNDLFKVKTWYDAEAIVVGYKEGEGRNTGRTGSLRLQMACKKVFECGGGMTDMLREHPPALGSVVVYKFQELSHEGTPRFPIYCGVSADKVAAKDAVVRSAQLRADAASSGTIPPRGI